MIIFIFLVESLIMYFDFKFIYFYIVYLKFLINIF